MYLIKLGGSVITEKSSVATFRSNVMDDLADQLARSRKDFIIVHGAGSFGHVLAKKYNLNSGLTDDKQLLGYTKTQALVQTLNTHVLTSLHEHSINAISIPPHAMLQLMDHEIDEFNMDFFYHYLKKGFVPITYGDVVLDSHIGFSICSGDLLMLALAKEFQPEKVIFVIDEEGIYDKNPKRHDDARLIESIKGDELDSLKTSLDSHADVTKGMAGKLQTIKKITALHIDTVLVNGLVPDRLYQILTDKSTIHTMVKG
jgi:isopentenyl phosphate kinase